MIAPVGISAPGRVETNTPRGRRQRALRRHADISASRLPVQNWLSWQAWRRPACCQKTTKYSAICAIFNY